jgi:peptidoglycan/xylan/chitin deacetylase (PgdA/CDA1 family)
MATNTLISTSCGLAAAVAVLVGTPGPESAQAATTLPALVVRVPILMYHRVGVTDASTPSATRRLTVDPLTFARQMRWLHRNGYSTLTQRELYRALVLRKRLPPKPVLITFDDGYDDLLRTALPVLEQLRMRATAYVITDRCGDWRSPFLAWFELFELQRRGIEIGSHTASHRDLRTLSDPELTHELVASRRALERRLHHPVPWLAYPFGGHNSRVVAAARRAGYLLAVTTVGGKQQFGPRPLELRRLSITNSTGTRGLASMLGGSG